VTDCARRRRVSVTVETPVTSFDPSRLRRRLERLLPAVGGESSVPSQDGGVWLSSSRHLAERPPTESMADIAKRRSEFLVDSSGDVGQDACPFSPIGPQSGRPRSRQNGSGL
jgi:hypothetical protein